MVLWFGCSSPRRCVRVFVRVQWESDTDRVLLENCIGERETGRRRCNARGDNWCRRGQRRELARCKKETVAHCARPTGAQCRGTPVGTGVQVETSRVTIFYSTRVCLIHIFKSPGWNFKLKERWVFFTVCVRGGTCEQREGGGLEMQKSPIYCFSVFSLFFFLNTTRKNIVLLTPLRVSYYLTSPLWRKVLTHFAFNVYLLMAEVKHHFLIWWVV